MAATITANDGTAVPKVLRVVGSFISFAVANVVVAATVTSVAIPFPQLKTIDGILGLTVRTQSGGAIRTNVAMTVSVSGNVLTLGESGGFDIDADTCVIDVAVWGKAVLM